MRLIVTILLNLVIILLVGVFLFVGFNVYKAYTNNESDITQFIEPAYLLSLINFNRDETWTKYDSITYTLDHPSSWKPLAKSSTSNSSTELVDLRIPVIFSLPRVGSIALVGYYRDTVSKIRPDKILEENHITFAGRQGFRWVYRKDENYFTYFYAVPLSSELTNSRQASTFVIIVEAVRRDKDLEDILDKLAASVTFKEI